MTNLDVAKAFAARGIAVFPCRSDKKPQPGVRWRDEATCNVITIEQWWRRWPGSLVAFEPGKHGLIAIDLDGSAGFEDWETISAGQQDAATVRVASPRGGNHIFFRNPDKLTNGRGALPPKRKIVDANGETKEEGIDIRGSGGYVIAEGTELPDGRCYRAPEDCSGLIDAIDAGTVPEIPAWLSDLLKSEKKSDNDNAPAPVKIMPRPKLGAGKTGDRERAAFLAALDAECAAVRSAGKGNRNNTLNTAAFNLGTAIGAGWGARDEAEADLMAAAMACGLDVTEARKTIRSGLGKGALKPREALKDRHDDLPILDCSHLIRRARVIDGVLVDEETGEVVDSDEEEDRPVDAVDEALTYVPGFLGEVVDWITASARRPNRRLALAAAIPLVGTLLGRRVASPTGLATHLYVVSTYPTGAGKQHALDCTIRLLNVAGLSHHIGPSQFMSVGAVLQTLKDTPLSFCPQDEFGAVLAKIGHPRASAHEKSISGLLRAAWGMSFGTMPTAAYAKSRAEVINCPAMSIYGTSTPDEFYRALKGADMANGFMNRFLIIDAGDRVPEVEPQMSWRDVPHDIIKTSQSLYAIGSDRTGNIGRVMINKNLDADPEPTSLKWATPQAQAVYRDLVSDCERRMDRSGEFGDLFGRTADIAQRCATILSASCPDGMRAGVSEEAMQWGAQLSLQSTIKIAADASHHMLDPLSAPEIERKIIARLREAPNRVATLRSLHRTLQRNFRFADDLKRSLDALARANIIVLEKMNIAGGERVTARLI